MTSQVLAPQPTLAATIKSYLYQQYANDDDLQAFVASFNAATQTYVDWFNSVNLPFYPGLTGDLLDWVAEGLYGLERTTLSQSASGALGPLNTAQLDAITLNSYVAPSATYYNITDDIFKRILTWNFYKGDGKRFCMKWLKRRIMRFLVGANGLDPNPLATGFVIGPENTQAISVTVASDTLTVTINGAALSGLVQVESGIVDIFKAAFLGGVLDLPAQYSYACNIVTQMTATVTPATESSTSTATTQTTGAASVSALGGNGAYTFAWTWASGGAGITINSPSAADTSFTASGMARGATLSGVAKCTVTDSASHSASVYVTVNIKNVSAPSVSLAPATLSVTGASASLTTGSTSATISGGAAPYSIDFTWQSGGAGLTINSPTGAATSITASGLSPGSTESGTLLCTVTDAYGQVATATCSVSASRVTLVSASVSPASLSSSSSTVPITTGSASVSVSGGQGPYSYAWSFAWTSHTDGATEAINSPTSASTSMTISGMTAGNTDTGNLQCVVRDAYGQQAIVNVSVSATYLPPLTRTYTSGSGVETVPNGYSNVEIELWGPGGGGAQGSGSLDTVKNGAGAGAGGYSRSGYACSGGETFNWALGAPGVGGNTGPGSAGTSGSTSTVSSGSLSITTMTAVGGGGATGTGTGVGAGGAASGGNQANVTGQSGQPGGAGASGDGGLSQPGIYGNTVQNASMDGAGGAGSPDGSRAGSAGNSALLVVRYS